MSNNHDSTLSSLAALSQDLKRISLGLFRGSPKMAGEFEKEAQKRKEGIDLDDLAPYLKKIIQKMNTTFMESDVNKKAENLLMYSTLIQNYVLRFH